MPVGVIPPTRIISYQQLVVEADPDWQRLKQRPWIYQFSTGRRFLGRPDIYTAPANGSAPLPPGAAPTVQSVALLNVGGAVHMTTPWEFPVTASGLLPGQIWWNAGVLTIVPGLPFDVTQPQLFLSDPSWLVLLDGAAAMPLSNPGKHNKRLYRGGSNIVSIDT